MIRRVYFDREKTFRGYTSDYNALQKNMIGSRVLGRPDKRFIESSYHSMGVDYFYYYDFTRIENGIQIFRIVVTGAYNQYPPGASVGHYTYTDQYGIEHNSEFFIVGWVRHDELGGPWPSTPIQEIPKYDYETDEPLPPDMTIEINGREHGLYDGINSDREIVLDPGINYITVKGFGEISIHFNKEVMG